MNSSHRIEVVVTDPGVDGAQDRVSTTLIEPDTGEVAFFIFHDRKLTIREMPEPTDG